MASDCPISLSDHDKNNVGLPCDHQCVLTGEWVNDLGSNMTIGPVNTEGKFDGSYLTAVKKAPGKIHISPLAGYQHATNIWRQPTFGFTVNWNFTGASPSPASLQYPQSSLILPVMFPNDPPINSITVFTGQCFVDDGGKETLKTMWLLRSAADNIKDDWKATMVGTNTFTRRYLQEQGGIVGDSKARRSTCDAQCVSCHPTCF
ncbi:avidin [Columba livia]|uniref:Avidin n=1 Tax=Columba livia TaxID=8932 RepID=A0A2I0LJC9_COLLI|nr:avidin [Columba livia]